jgi:hypothetical protein
MEFLVVFLILLVLGASYVIYNLYNKYSRLETIAQENLDFIMSMRNRVLSQQSYLKQLDRKGAFESDDETGYFFKELKKIINDIANYLELESEQDNGEKDVSTNIFRGKVGRF